MTKPNHGKQRTNAGPYSGVTGKDKVRHVSDNGDSQGRGSTPDTKPRQYFDRIERSNSGFTGPIRGK